MSLDKLIPTEPDGEEHLPAEVVGSRGYAPLPYDEDEPQKRPGQRSKLQRYLSAVLRRKWLLGIALVVGALGSAGAYTVLGVEYTAEGNLWVQVEARGGGDVGPIRQGELLESYAWLDLLKSYAVLDPVVVSERLYLTSPPEFERAFEDFDLKERFAPGTYVLKVDAEGRNFQLSTNTGALQQSGAFGDSIGADLGFIWQPAASLFSPEAEVAFRLLNPRDASRSLMGNLDTGMDRLGNFISLSLSGDDPQKIADILNAIMERYIELAADLKRRKLDETLGILEDQYVGAGISLEDAERELEDFRVRTITLPSDASTPIAPGIELTRDPVFASFFAMKVRLEDTKRDREELQRALTGLQSGDVRIESFEAIPAVSQSTEMSQVVDELVGLRARLRAYRNNYTDDFPPIQDLLRQINALERETIPRVARGLVEQLQARELQLQTMVDSAAVELAEIPSRSIEEARLRRQVNVQENLYNELRSRVETGRLASASSIADVQILDRAAAPQVPTSDDRLRLAAMILFGALGGAIALAILLDHGDSRIRHADEVDSVFGLEILGSIPRIDGTTGAQAEDSAAQVVEAFRELRVHVSFAYGSAGPVTLAVTSPAKGEGKTLVTTNLAVAFSEMGRRTLLIDADTRRGDAHKLLGLARSPGLTDYLKARVDADIIQTTEYKNLEFIGSGTRGPTTPELLASKRMGSFLGTLKRAYDVILVDCPPLAAGADALVLGGLTGHLAVVLRTGSTDKRLAVAKLEVVSRLPIRVLGAVLNDVEPKGQYYKYYGSYLPGYDTHREEEEGEVPERSTRLLSGVQAGHGGVEVGE